MGRTVGMLQTQSVGGADDPVPNVPAQHNKEMSLHVGVTWKKHSIQQFCSKKEAVVCRYLCIKGIK